MAQHTVMLKDPKEDITFGAAVAEILSVLPANRVRVSTPSIFFSIVGYVRQSVELISRFYSSRGITFQSEEESSQNTYLWGAVDHSLRFHRLRAAYIFQGLFDTISREHFINSAKCHHYHPRSLQHLENIWCTCPNISYIIYSRNFSKIHMFS